MTLSKYETIFLGIQFKEIGKLGFWETIASWTIDSNLGKTKKLNLFLKDQIYKCSNTENELYKLAIKLQGKTPLETVYNIERYVFYNFAYMNDSVNYKATEYWADWSETMHRKNGDCEDLNSLIYLLCRLAGIRKENLYCCLGDIIVGYHYWTLFYDSKRHRFVKLDVTAWPEIKPIKDKAEFQINDTSYTKVDFVFNEEKILRIKNE